MRVAGFVSELNPFHNGHAYFISQLRANGATHVITAMSGCFVQRGEAALTDKMLRAEAAVKSGVDLVLDLPVPWALGSAESFARGGVSLLVSFGCDLLSFGCETDDAALLKQTAVMLGSEKVREATAARMKRGCTYPAALAQTLEAMGEERALHLLETPNNVLAVEYLKALEALHTDLPVLPVRRTGASHDALLQDGVIQSASALRSLPDVAAMRPYLPQTVYDVLEKHPGRLLDRQSFETAVLTALRLLPDSAFTLKKKRRRLRVCLLLTAAEWSCWQDAAAIFLLSQSMPKQQSLTNVRNRFMHCNAVRAICMRFAQKKNEPAARSSKARF